VVEEGLAEYAGCLLTSESFPARRIERRRESGARLRVEDLDVSILDYLHLTQQRRDELAEACLVFVADVGFERLLRMLEEGELTRERLLALIEPLDEEAARGADRGPPTVVPDSS